MSFLHVKVTRLNKFNMIYFIAIEAEFSGWTITSQSLSFYVFLTLSSFFNSHEQSRVYYPIYYATVSIKKENFKYIYLSNDIACLPCNIPIITPTCVL